MKYEMLLLSVVVIAIGAIFGVAFRDDLFGAYLFALSGLAVAVPATVILGLVVLGLVLAKRRPWKAVSYSLVVSASFVVAFYVFMEAGSTINRWKVDAVDRYVARAVPVLDGIKHKNGSYPSKLPTDVLGEDLARSPQHDYPCVLLYLRPKRGIRLANFECYFDAWGEVLLQW
jgi:hypothetical protein